MSRLTPRMVRRRFFVAVVRAFQLTWPVLSTILAFQVVLGVVIGLLEGWSLGDAVYFTFITGLTIGYGDIVPRVAIARVLAILIGISGLFLTGVIAGIAVYAMHAAIGEGDSD
jgi:Ion channel